MEDNFEERSVKDRAWLSGAGKQRGWFYGLR